MAEEEKDLSSITLEESKAAAEALKKFFGSVSVLLPHLEALRLTAVSLRRSIDRNESIGFIAGPGYQHVTKEYAGKLERVEAVLNLVETLARTAGDMDGRRKMRAERAEMDDMLGLL